MRLLSCLTMALVVLLSSGVAFAVENGSLTLVMRHESGGKTSYVSGTTATAYLVADLDEAVNFYTLRDEFASLDVNFNDGMDAETMGIVATKAADIVSAKGISGVSATSGANGTISFGMLPKGVYLVVQTGTKGVAQGYTQLTPFLISVPEVTEDDVVFDVTAYPKIAPIPPTPDKMPQTNDPSNPWLWVTCLLVGSVMVAIGNTGLRRLREREALQG